MTDQATRTCPTCSGRGTRTETYTDVEPDVGTSVALGVALGGGYFPMNRTVTRERQVTCSTCGGSGRIH